MRRTIIVVSAFALALAACAPDADGSAEAVDRLRAELAVEREAREAAEEEAAAAEARAEAAEDRATEAEDTEAEDTDDPEPDGSDQSGEETRPDLAVLPDLSAEEWLAIQLRHHVTTEAQIEAEMDLGFDPGPTSWSPREDLEGFDDEEWATPGAAAIGWATRVAGADRLGVELHEIVLRSEWVHGAEGETDEVTVVVQAWGYQDDSVAGTDWRIRMVRDGEVWVVDTVEERWHCWRGGTDICV